MKIRKLILLGLIAVLVIGGSAFCDEPEEIAPASAKENIVVRVYRTIENGVVSRYKSIENGVVSDYKKIENGVVAGYEAIEDKFVDAFLVPEKQSFGEQDKSN